MAKWMSCNRSVNMVNALIIVLPKLHFHSFLHLMKGLADLNWCNDEIVRSGGNESLSVFVLPVYT